MRRHLIALVASIVLTLPAVREAGAQENSVLHRKIDAQLGAIGESARGAVEGLLYYPKEVRDACLELACYPALIVRLNDALDRGGFAPDKVLAEYPPIARTAARVLAGSSGILHALEDDLVAIGVLGRVYAQDRVGVMRLVDVLSVKADLAVTRAADAWVDSLSLNALAVAELQRAADDYARRRRETTVTISADLGHGFGFSVEASSDIAIHYAPTYAETRFVLFNADRYPHLADALVYQYHTHYDDSLADFHRAYDEWYHQRARYHHDDFFHAAGRAERLRQAAAYERRFAGAHKSRATRHSHAERNEFLRGHAADYPSLRTFRDPATARGPRYVPTRTTPRRTPARVRRPSDRQAPARATRKPGKGKARADAPRTHRPNVTRKQPTSAQRIKRAGKARGSAADPRGGKRKSRTKRK